MATPIRLFEMLALTGYFAASLLALAAQLTPRAGRPRQALGLSLTAFVLHSLLLLLYLLQRQPLDLRAVFLGLGWGFYLVTTLLSSFKRQRLAALQAAAYPGCALIFVTAVLQPAGRSFSDTATLTNPWFIAHLAGLSIGVVLCGAAAVYSVLYLLEDRRLKRFSSGPADVPQGGLLPALETSDRLAIRCLGVGFIFLSLGIFAGLTLLANGKEYGYELRNPLDFVTSATLLLWALMFLTILARALSGLSGRRSAWMQIAAALLAALTVALLSSH